MRDPLQTLQFPHFDVKINVCRCSSRLERGKGKWKEVKDAKDSSAWYSNEKELSVALAASGG